MNNQNKLGATIGKASPAPQPQLSFFNQIVGGPNPLNPREMVIQVIPNTGIPARDYFAIRALHTLMFDYDREVENFPAIARDAYRMADAMIEARKISGNDLRANPGDSAADGSQFHEDHMKPKP